MPAATNYTDFYKEIYYKEVDRRNQINNSISTPIGLLTALLTVQFYFLINFQFTKNDFVAQLFLLSISFGGVMALFAVYFLGMAFSYIKNEIDYPGLPPSTDIDKYRKELIDFHGKKIGDEKFNEYLIGKYTEYTDQIILANDKRETDILNVNKYFSYSTISVLLQVIFFLINFFTNPEKSTKVNIDTPVIIKAKSDSVESKVKKDSLNLVR